MNKLQRRTLLTLGLSLILSVVSCLPGFSPTVTPTNIPTSTPWPPGPENLLSDASALCEKSVKADNKTGDVDLVKGSVFSLMNTEENGESAWKAGAPPLPFIGALIASEVRFLLCVKESNKVVDSYTDGSSAIKLHWNVKLLRYPTGEIVKATSLEGGEPPLSKLEGGAGIGSAPKQELIRWLGLHVLIHGTNVGTVAFSPDGKLVASGTNFVYPANSTIKLWAAESGQEVHSLQNHCDPLAFSTIGNFLAFTEQCGNSSIVLWDIKASRVVRVLNGHIGGVSGLAFSPKSSFLVSGDENGEIKLWSYETGELIQSISAHTDDIRRIIFSPDGTMFASASFDGSVKLWDSVTYSEKHVINIGGWVDRINFSPDGSRLAIGYSQAFTLWDTSSGEMVLSVSLGDSYAESLSFTPDGKVLAVGKGVASWVPGTELRVNCIGFFDVKTGQELSFLCGHTDTVKDLAFSPDGLFLISGSHDGTVILWDLATER